MKIAYLGPKDSFSYLAAQKFCGGGDELLEYPTITHALQSVGGECCAAVVPLENSSEGSVSDTLDALIQNDGLFINYEYELKIEQKLLTLRGAKLKDITKIITHRQPYGQCRESVSRLFPGAEIVFADSTSAAALAVKDKHTAAIGGAQLANSILCASDFNLNDQEENRTRFVYVSKNNIADAGNTKTTVVFESENKPGGLVALLKIFNEYGINMIKIESRPRKGFLDRYLFIVNLTGSALDKKIETALQKLRKKTVFYKFLGSYKTI